jgi:hypothetical protein
MMRVPVETLSKRHTDPTFPWSLFGNKNSGSTNNSALINNCGSSILVWNQKERLVSFFLSFSKGKSVTADWILTERLLGFNARHLSFETWKLRKKPRKGNSSSPSFYQRLIVEWRPGELWTKLLTPGLDNTRLFISLTAGAGTRCISLLSSPPSLSCSYGLGGERRKGFPLPGNFSSCRLKPLTRSYCRQALDRLRDRGW